VSRLWVQLSLAFAFTGFVVISAIAIVLRYEEVGDPAWDIAITTALLQPNKFTAELAARYEQNGNWEFAGPLLEAERHQYAATLHTAPHFELVTADQSQTLYSTLHSQYLHLETSALYVPIGPDDQPYAYLRATSIRFPLGEVTAFLGVLFLSFVFSIGFGVFISRRLTRPLRDLAASAHTFRDRHLDHRAAVQGSSEIKAVALAFNAMAEGLQASEAIRRNLVADVAHELRTPLTVLQSRLYGMLDDVYELDKAEIANLLDQIRLLSRLVNDLMELSLAEARQLPLDLRLVELKPLLEEALVTFDLVAQDKAITFITQIDDQLPPVLIDSERINQVFFNLVSNALRHTPAGGTIHVDATLHLAEVNITIQDTGDGIPPEHLAHIFERFYRVDPSRQRASGGSGLGLAIVKAIVQGHGGTVIAHSDGIPGQGTRFVVSLPASDTPGLAPVN